MVRKAVRTYSQILAGFARADEEDARIREFYEPSAPATDRRASADPESSQHKRPASAARKHRYAHLLDWNDDITAIYNVDRHDGGVRFGASPTAAAFAADRRGNATRALAAALNCAVETASRLTLSPAPTTSHTSRLAERLLRATQAPLPAAVPPTTSTPAGSTHVTPRPDSPNRGDGTRHQAWEAASGDSPSWPSSPLSTSPFPAAAYAYEQQQQQQQQVSGSLLSTSAHLLYYGSSRPRLHSAGPQGRGRPVSAPAQQGKQQRLQLQPPAGPEGTRREGWGGAGVSSVNGGGGGTASVVRPASARPASSSGSGQALGGARRSPSRPASAIVATSPYAASVATAAGSTAFSTRRRSTASSSSVPRSLTVATASSVVAARPQSSPQRSPGSSLVGAPVYGTVAAAAATVVAPAPVSVSPATVRYLGVNPRHLQQIQEKHGPCNGVVVRDPIGPQLVPGRRLYGMRPFSAPPGGPTADGAVVVRSGAAADAAAAAATHGVATQPKAKQQQQQQQQQSVSPQRQPRASSPPYRDRGGGAASPPARQYGAGGALRGEDSLRSTLSAPNGVSTTSIGSVAAAAAAAAAAATVNAGVTMARRRHGALDGARKALWSQIADAAGVMPYDLMDDMMMDDGQGAAASGSIGARTASASANGGGRSPGPQLAAYLAQQAVAGPASGGSSRAHSRTNSPDPWARGAGAGSGQRLLAVDDSEGFGPEVSAAHYLLSANPAAADGDSLAEVETEASEAPPPPPPPAAAEVGADATANGDDAGKGADATANGDDAGKGDEASTAATEPGEPAQAAVVAAAPAVPPRLRPSGQGTVFRVSSLMKRSGANTAPRDDSGTLGASAAAAASKRVQWGADVTSSPPHSPQLRVELGTDGTEDDDTAAGELPERNSGAGVDLGRPPRYPSAVAGVFGQRSSPAASPLQTQLHLSPGGGASGGVPSPLTPGRRRRLGLGRDRPYGDDDDDDIDIDAVGADDDDSIPSLEVSTAAGVLDRARPAAAAGGQEYSSDEAALPSYTDPDFYHLTAHVDRTTDVQGWLFNVYITDISPDNPVARRCCVASCTTADEHKRLLIPQPSATVAAAAATAAPPQVQPLAPHRAGPVISPADLLPWVTRPDQLLGHWLRLEAFAISPLADKVVDAVMYMGRLEDAAPPQPRLSRLQVLEVRPTSGGSRGGGKVLAAAGSGGQAAGLGLGRQQQQQQQQGMSNAGSAAMMQAARLGASGAAGGLLGGPRPTSARRTSPYRR